MVQKVAKGEFIGTMGKLERLARREHCLHLIKWEPRFKGYATLGIYVDASGTIYAENPETGKMTIPVGRCIPEPGK